jgi:hypothetical protein
MTIDEKALKAALQAAADAITLTPVPPIPPVGKWPLDLSANPTGPKKPLGPNQGSITTTKDGQILDAITANIIIVKHNDVRITNFKAQSIQQDPASKGLTCADGVIDGENKIENACQWANYSLTRVEITRTIDGCKGHGATLIADCYLHDNTFATGSGTGAGGYTHGDALQVSAGNSISFTRNRVENYRGNSGVFIDPDQATISEVAITSNYFTNVGNYPIYVKESASNPSTGLPKNVSITNNTIGKRRTDTPPEWGPMLCEVRATGLTFTGNIDQTTGKIIKLDNAGKGYI